MSPQEAAHRTMDEVGGALISIALTLCAVFVPSAFLSGISGLFFGQFAVAIAASTVISCFVSLTLSPALCAALFEPHDAHIVSRAGLARRLLHKGFDRFNRRFEVGLTPTPAAEVQGVAAPGVASGTALHRMEELAHQVLPKGIGFEWTELAYQEQQRGTPTLLVFGAAALFVFLVLVAQYESWKLPLAIVLIVPMCLLASVTGLLARGLPIDILSQIGFVVLVGLAAKVMLLVVAG
jgi:multidrug efflux pump subunit AcrB